MSIQSITAAQLAPDLAVPLASVDICLFFDGLCPNSLDIGIWGGVSKYDEIFFRPLPDEHGFAGENNR
jgi:hypothetical protein